MTKPTHRPPRRVIHSWKQSIVTALAMVVGATSARAATPADPAAVSDLISHGRQTMAVLDRTFAATGKDTGYYLEEVHPGDTAFKTHPSLAWGSGLQLSALIAATRVDPKQYRAPMLRYARILDSHWCVDEQGLGGYTAWYRAGKPDRYYDDNAWFALDFCEAYALTGDKGMLDRARKTMAFMLSGEDSQLGGGIYWHEQKKTSKNTCINAPAAACALRLYRLTGERQYLDVGNRLYAWTKAHLQDPNDGLYYDSIKLDGTIDKPKYSYNTALMIRTACLLFDQTGDRAYLGEAQRMAHSAEAKWFKPDGTVTDVAYFGNLMVEALLDVGQRDGDRHWADLARRTCDVLWQQNRDPNGLFAEHWDKRPGAQPLERAKVMWQASDARLFFNTAAVLGGR